MVIACYYATLFYFQCGSVEDDDGKKESASDLIARADAVLSALKVWKQHVIVSKWFSL